MDPLVEDEDDEVEEDAEHEDELRDELTEDVQGAPEISATKTPVFPIMCQTPTQHLAGPSTATDRESFSFANRQRDIEFSDLWLARLSITPNSICDTPSTTDNFILNESRNVILLIANCHTCKRKIHHLQIGPKKFAKRRPETFDCYNDLNHPESPRPPMFVFCD